MTATEYAIGTVSGLDVVGNGLACGWALPETVARRPLRLRSGQAYSGLLLLCVNRVKVLDRRFNQGRMSTKLSGNATMTGTV